MRISSQYSNKSSSFRGLYNNKILLKGLEKISEHSTSFIAGTTLVMATGIRPLAINLTPNVKKENKEYATTNSIASGIIKFGLVEAVAIPVEKAVKQIDKNPEKYLNKKTIKTLKGSAKTLAESRNYKFATQIMKLSTGLLTAIPKAILTVSLIPVFMSIFYRNKQKTNKNFGNENFYNEYNPIFTKDFGTTKCPSFKGLITNQTAKELGKILNNSTIQNTVKKLSNNDTNIARNISIATDILLTTSFVHQTKKNKEIKEERKNALIWNNVISTALSILSGFSIDKLVQKGTEKFIKKFAEINKNDPKLHKYIEGINILRPTLIFAGIYYMLLPMISTYIADKTDVSEKKEK